MMNSPEQSSVDIEPVNAHRMVVIPEQRGFLMVGI